MENQKYCVYMHTNKINGKKYIGITCKDPEKRWNNGYGYCRNKHFFSAIQKYGWNSFEHKILAKNLTSEEAGNMEKDFIAKYKSNLSEYGYNICSGGETNILPKESLEKISNSKKGKPITEAMKQGRKLNPPKAKKVICEGIEFVSIADCARYYEIDPKKMRDWLSGNKYIPEDFVQKGLAYKNEPIEFEQIKSNRKWVYCDGLEFSSIEECAKYYNIRSDRIKHWLYGVYNMPEFYKEKNLHQFYKTLYRVKKQIINN